MSDATVVEPTLRHTPGSARPEGPVIVASPFPMARAGEVLTAEALGLVTADELAEFLTLPAYQRLE